MALLAQILETDSATRVIVISGQGEKENALKAIGEGAYDFFCKPVNVDELKTIIGRAFQVGRLEREFQSQQQELATEGFADMLGKSPAIKQVFTTIRKLDSASAPVLVPLGSFPDPDALRVHLRDGFPEATPDAAPATETDVDAAFRCLGKIDGMFNTGSEPAHVGLATVANEPTVVYELPYRTDDGRDTTLVVAVGELTCIPSLSFQR